MIHEFLQKHYFFEIERRDRLNQQATFTAALAALYFPLFGRIVSSPNFDSLQSVIAAILAFISAVPAILFAVHFYGFFGYTAKYISNPDDIFRSFKIRTLFDRSNSPEFSSVSELYEDICEDFADATAHNRSMNLKKSKALLDANRSIYLGLLIAGIGYIVSIIH